MKFGWINGFGAAIVIIMLIPNIVYAIKIKGEENLCKNKFMNAIEQIGRYACIVLMWLPLFVWEFGFKSVLGMLLYLSLNGALLLIYVITFIFYMKRKTVMRAIFLAVIPSCIFVISAILLRHWLLLGFAVLFTTGHVFVTLKNTKRLIVY